MDKLFGSNKTPEQTLREYQRILNRAIRDLDREREKMIGQEKKVIEDTKETYKAGQIDDAKTLAKDLIRTRSYVKQFILMRASTQALFLKIQTLRSQNAMENAMKEIAKEMATRNKKMKLPQLQKIMMEFERQTGVMDMEIETFDLYDADITGSNDEEETEEMVLQVFEELGLQ